METRKLPSSTVSRSLFRLGRLRHIGTTRKTLRRLIDDLVGHLLGSVGILDLRQLLGDLAAANLVSPAHADVVDTLHRLTTMGDRDRTRIGTCRKRRGSNYA